jgi:hypothetical protein
MASVGPLWAAPSALSEPDKMLIRPAELTSARGRSDATSSTSEMRSERFSASANSLAVW